MEVMHASNQVIKQPMMDQESLYKKAAFAHPTHQICFCTGRALKCLKFDRSEFIHD